ncbi:MAG: hypothetical protein V3R65_10305 [Acidiferrobacterales bacterium]
MKYIKDISVIMENRMEKYLFMRPFLKLLGTGPFFTRLVASMLRILAALIVLGSLALIFKAGKFMFELPASGLMGGVMYVLFFILAIYAVVHTLIIRARDIEAQKEEDYFILPVASILTRLAGEAYAAYVALTAVGGGIFVWFTGEAIGKIMDPIPFLFPTTQKPNFMGGIELILIGVLLAAGAIIASYVIAELVTALSRATSYRQPRSGDSTGPRHIDEHNTHSRIG